MPDNRTALAEINEATSGLIRAHELLAEKYSEWSPESGTVFKDRYAIEAAEGIRLAGTIIAALRADHDAGGAVAMREDAS